MTDETAEAKARVATRRTKYEYLWILQGFYGYGDGWEDLCASERRREIRDDLRAYRENEAPYMSVRYRVIQRRELRQEIPQQPQGD